MAVPADAIHGDWVNLAIEADGMPLGRSRLQLFRPASIRVAQAIQIHFGSQTELTPEPNIAPVEPKAGTNLEISDPQQLSGNRRLSICRPRAKDSSSFRRRRTSASARTDERSVSLRVFAAEGVAGLRDWRLQVTGGATLDIPMRVLLLPRGRTVAWSADLDGDGSPEWVLESQKVRAVFSSQNGGRWMEFNWKDGNANFLPEAGHPVRQRSVEVHAAGDDGLEFTGKGWRRTVRLKENVVTVEQTPAVPADRLGEEKRGNVTLSIERVSPSRVIYSMK